jgi:hypothetical protein
MALIPCRECSKEISDKAPVCPHCGASLESKGAGLPVKIASLCFPPIGLVLCLWWINSKPRVAKDVCLWALSGVITGVVFSFLAG